MVHVPSARAPHASAALLLLAGALSACGSASGDARATAALAAGEAVPASERPTECRRLTRCVPENPCHVGLVTACRNGEPVCTDVWLWVANGTSCGDDLVCSNGTCVPCSAGDACQPTDSAGAPLSCHTGVTSCDTGKQVCVDTGAAQDGTACGEGSVCHAGECGACASGALCQVDGQQCTWGTIDCSTGLAACQSPHPAPVGTPCDAGVCDGAGQCVASCVDGTPCTSADGCATGQIVCASPIAGSCNLTGTAPDGTSCASGVCSGGVCAPVASTRTVHGTALTTFWTDAGPQLLPNDGLLSAGVTAVIPDANGGYAMLPATVLPDGSFTIDGVPQGRYLVYFFAGAPMLVETDASEVDLGDDRLGRPGVGVAPAGTSVTFGLSGLDPWSSTDRLKVISSNAGLMEWPAAYPPVPETTVTAGAQSATVTASWDGSPLLDGAAGDQAWVVQGSTRALGTGGLAYVAATRFGALPGDVTVIGGAPTSVDVALQEPGAFGSLQVSWPTAAYEPYGPSLCPTPAAGGTHRMAVLARPRVEPLAPTFTSGVYVGSVAPDLFWMTVPAGTAPLELSGLPFGRFLPPPWTEFRETRFSVPCTVALPAGNARRVLHVGRVDPLDGAPAVAAPLVGAPTSLRIAGADAFTPGLAVPEAPLVTWVAPSPAPPGTPIYTITALRAHGTTLVPALVYVTRDTQVRLPPALTWGETYVLQLEVRVSQAERPEAPLRRSFPAGYATVLSAPFLLGQPSPRQLATFTDGTTAFYYNPPTIANGRVYIGTSHKAYREPDAANRFFALDMELREIWHHDLGGWEVRGAATVDSAGNVYFVVEAGRSLGTQAPLRLYSVTPDGSFRWSVEVDPYGAGIGMSNPAVAADDTIYVGGWDGLYAFAPDGTQRWHFPAWQVINAPVIDPAGNVYFVTLGTAYSVTVAGAERWRTALADWGEAVSSPAFSTDYSGVFVANGGTVERLDAATGASQWHFRPPDVTGDFRATPAVDDHDNVYVGTKSDQQSTLYAFRADGTGLLWERFIGADLYSSPALGDDGTLYVGSEHTDGSVRLHAVDMATGETRWSAPLASDITWSSPAIVPGGTLYVATMACDECTHGAVVAFDTDSTGLLPGAGSPRFHEGNASTGRRE